MAPPKIDNPVQAALIKIEYTLGPNGVPFFTAGDQENPEPKLTILTGTQDHSGRIHMGSMLTGADNGPEQQALIQAWVVITQGIHGRFGI